MSVKFQIEAVFPITNRGKYVFAKIIEQEKRFFVPQGSFLSDVQLTEFISIPNALDKDGQARTDLVAFQLRNEADEDKLIIGSIVELIPGDRLHFLDPWNELEENAAYFEKELERELIHGHPLYGKKVKAIAISRAADDVLFEITDDNKFHYAVVHLTYQQETDPRWPSCAFYTNWQDVYSNCIVTDYKNNSE